MSSDRPFRTIGIAIISVTMILLGLTLAIWLFNHMPIDHSIDYTQPVVQLTDSSNVRVQPTIIHDASLSKSVTTTLTENSPLKAHTREKQSILTPNVASSTMLPIANSKEVTPTVIVSFVDDLPHDVATSLYEQTLSYTNIFTAPTGAFTTTLHLDWHKADGHLLYQQFFAAATRFDTIEPSIDQAELSLLWQSQSNNGLAQSFTQNGNGFKHIAVLTATIAALEQILGPAGDQITGYHLIEEINEAVWQDRTKLAIIPFEQLRPTLSVLSIDGQNPVENENKFEAKRYPLVANLYAHHQTRALPQWSAELALLSKFPTSNRNPEHLTVIAMTGVTAMVRMTASQMDQLGVTWPAEVVGPTLAAADITTISNEVPFVVGCQTNIDPNNLTFCSKPDYMAALTASGVDIIGLTGNHQNDYGREDALKSLEIYVEAGLSVYGGGIDLEAASAPLYLEHNGNRLAFLGANSYGPEFAWATDSLPGSAKFNLQEMSAQIQMIKNEKMADVILAEIQYQESYQVEPLFEQRQDFNLLNRAGADIVTGIQSHVPQAVEFTDGKLILYGLGNLYFDQMWSQQTREGLIVKHSIYQGRHINTQLLTTLLYDFGQPQWATSAQRDTLLTRLFAASYWE